MKENKNQTQYSWLGKAKNIYSQEDIVYSPFLYGIRRFGILEISSKEEIRLIPYISQYIYIIVNKGTLLFEQGNYQVVVNEGECILREGWEETHWKCHNSDKIECYYLLLTGNNISFFYSEYERQNKNVLPYTIKMRQSIDSIIEETKKSNIDKKVMSTYIYALLLEIIDPSNINKNKITQKALDFIDKEYSNNDLSIKDLADSLHISYHYFCHLFKQENLVSPQKYLAKYRLNKALQLLKDSHLSVEDIYVTVGFKNKQAFIKECKEETGLRPFAYRRANHNVPLIAKQTKKILFTNVSNIGDPFIIVENKKYYMFTTIRNGTNINCYVSEDMKYYDVVGGMLDTNKKKKKRDFWAPDVIKYKDEYYMFYSSRSENNSINISVAKAKNITGPYKDINQDSALLNLGQDTLDAHPFIDKDGKPYLFFVLDCLTNIIDGKHVSEICVIELSDDLSKTKGEIHKILSPSEKWERKTPNNYYRIQAPSVIYKNGTYYLTYSANNFRDINYCSGLATSKSILGPYIKKKDGPIAKRIEGVISAPGSISCFYDLKGNLKCVYHIFTNIKQNTSDRRACISSVYINDRELVIDYKA